MPVGRARHRPTTKSPGALHRVCTESARRFDRSPQRQGEFAMVPIGPRNPPVVNAFFKYVRHVRVGPTAHNTWGRNLNGVLFVRKTRFFPYERCIRNIVRMFTVYELRTLLKLNADVASDGNCSYGVQNTASGHCGLENRYYTIMM